MLRDPKEYCPSCGARYSFSYEFCRHCGFDPVSNEEDALIEEKAIKEYKDANPR